MPKATRNSTVLSPIDHCFIQVQKLSEGVPNGMIIMDNLPDISDSKSAIYSDETAMGRSSPFKNYSHSDNRTISWTCHFFTTTSENGSGNSDTILSYLRLLEACTYPFNNGATPYSPPPICHLKCGKLLGNNPVCAILKSYSVKFDTSLPWDELSCLPYKIDVDLQFEVVYNQSDLPGADTIMTL